MLSYRKFIQEQENDVGEIVEKIISDCQPFLDAIDGEVNEYRMYRGIKSNEDFMKKKIRSNRKSSSTPSRVQEAIDDYFEEQFGIRYRSNSMFASGSSTTVHNYGNPYIVFPIGKYQILWSKQIEDLFMDLPRDLRLETNVEDLSEEQLKEKIYNFFNNSNYQEGNLKSAIKSENEIMITGKGYYAISEEFFDEMNLGDEIQDAYEF